MGEAFDRLGAAVRRFHSFAGLHAFEGQVEVHAPSSPLAALLALCLGTPLRAANGPIRFELDAAPELETWTRWFPTHTMRSRLARGGGRVVEYLGAARLAFELRETAGALEMRLERMQFLGVPCPSWLMPNVTAIETGEGDKLYFQVHATVPLVGTVASYSGHLDIAPGEIP